MDARAPRDGKTIEELGYYDPLAKTLESREVLNVDRLRYWLSVGAQPSEKVAVILERHGVTKPNPSANKGKPRKRNRTERTAAKQHAIQSRQAARAAKLAAKAKPSTEQEAEEAPPAE
jgi:small subunit ribosomal protein S16